jgi:hypothetical protein
MSDIAADYEGLEALSRPEKRQLFTLYDAGLKDGDELSYTKSDSVKSTVINARRVLFEGNEESLSSSALKLLRRDDYQWQQANAWIYWMHDGETIAERLNRRMTEGRTEREDI